MRVLIIEDDKDIANFLKSSLEHECFTVDVAQDGEKGSFVARTNHYDIIILDNVLPKKYGRTVCEDIRSDGKTTPILILSVKSDTSTKIDLLNAGADDYLTKPFSFNELIARLHALMRRPAQIDSEIVKFGDLEIDLKKNLVWRGESKNKKEIYLTRKEFALLIYLFKNRDVVVSRGMILEHVWDMNADPFSNTIESHIRTLRQKIEVKNKNPLIHTISGRGYKLSLNPVLSTNKKSFR